MGSASCKNPNTSEQNKQKGEKEEDSKKITIGVFGLNNAGKTSAVKAIEGAPTEDVEPTMSSETTKVPYPTVGKRDKKSDERITIIDVSGNERFRQKSWPDYYSKIHGLIYVVDASDKKHFTENKNTLEDLLENDDLKDKPILILANKQDVRGAITKEDDIKDKLQIEELRRKHKIELCTAIPDGKNKADVSIRQGFSWLIRAIEDDYKKINARVDNKTNSRAPKPMERKTQLNSRRKNDSDDSDKDDGIVHARNRATTPPTTNKKTNDYRSMIDSIKLPNLDLSKTKVKRSGNETYSESDHDDDIKSRSRSNVSRPFADANNRNQSSNQSTAPLAGGLNKKKKLTGATTGSNNSDLPTKKFDDNQPKSFRSSYEPFPEEAPWSSTAKKTTKPDDLTSRSYTKPPGISDFNKRSASPLVHDIKPYSSSTTAKRDKGSDDDDDDFSQKQKSKSTLPSINKPSSTYKKPLSTIYGRDEDDDVDSKNINTNRRLNPASPLTTKKPYKNDDDDDDNGYLKKRTPGITKTFDSDDESKNKSTFNKPNQRPADRYDPMSEYRGTAAKPPASPSLKTSQAKLDDYLASSSLSKPAMRSKSTKDEFSLGYTKPTIGARYPDDNNDNDSRPVSISKINTQSKYGDDDQLSALNKFSTRPKYGDVNRPSSPVRLNTRSKTGDDDLPLSSSKPSTRPRYDDDNISPYTSKPITRTINDTNDRPSSALKPNNRSRLSDDDDYGSKSKATSKTKYEDDDDDTPPSWKPTTRSNYKDNDRSSSPYKSNTRPKVDDDDDDDYKPSSKPSTRGNLRDSDRSPPLSKPATRSRRFGEDEYGSKSKPNSTSNFEDDEDPPSSSKPITRSTYKDTDRSSSPFKANPRSKYNDDDDDDRSSPVKRTNNSNFEDDDDLPTPSSKKNNFSSRDDDYSRSGGARPRYGKDPYDS